MVIILGWVAFCSPRRSSPTRRSLASQLPCPLVAWDMVEPANIVDARLRCPALPFAAMGFLYRCHPSVPVIFGSGAPSLRACILDLFPIAPASLWMSPRLASGLASPYATVFAVALTWLEVVLTTLASRFCVYRSSVPVFSNSITSACAPLLLMADDTPLTPLRRVSSSMLM